MSALQKLTKNKWVISIALNIIALFVILLFFEITPKSDDYNMAQILYGTYSDGTYSEFLLYTNPIIGLINKWLLQIFPNVAWYYIFQYILMVLCFSFVLRIALDRLNLKTALIYWIIMMPICGYDFYSRITFSKTSALLMVVGLICLLYAIGNKKVLFYIFGFLFVTFGILYRSGLFYMEVFCFIPSLILEIKHIWKSKKDLVKTALKFAVIVVGLFVIYTGARYINNYMYANSEWSHHSEYNSARAKVVDYPWIDYEENIELYQEYDVTEAKYTMWESYNNVLDMSLDEFKLANVFQATAEDRNISTRTFFNSLGNQLCSNLMLYVMLIFLVFLILSKNKDKWWLIASICGVLILAILVMYYRGRLAYHANEAVLMACSMQLMYYASNRPDKKYGSYVLAGLIYLIGIYYNYDMITTSAYYLANPNEKVDSYKDYIAENYKNTKLLSDDKEHFYLMSVQEKNHIYECFTALQVMPRYFYSNIAYGGQGICHVLQEESLDNYGLYTPYKDMVDNLDAFYCFTDWTEYQIEGIADYIRDEHGIECTPVLLKQAEEMSLYRYCSHELVLEDIDYIEDTSDIISEINVDIVDYELDISGYAYIEGEDSFAQNIYVELEDPETDEEYYYYTLQTENEALKYEDKYNGKYSDFSAEINLSETDLQDYLVYVIFEINNNYYKIAVE